MEMGSKLIKRFCIAVESYGNAVINVPESKLRRRTRVGLEERLFHKRTAVAWAHTGGLRYSFDLEEWVGAWSWRTCPVGEYVQSGE